MEIGLIDSKLLICYAPGLGGNHVANLLSTSDRYHRSVKLERYFEAGHARWCAHFDDAKQDSNIMLNHFNEIVTDRTQKFCSGDNVIRLVLALPATNDLAWSRFEMWNNVPLRSNYLRHELDTIYKQQYLNRLLPGRWETLFTDDLFNETKIDLVLDQLRQKTDCDFDHDCARNLHRAWIDRISASLM